MFVEDISSLFPLSGNMCLGNVEFLKNFVWRRFSFEKENGSESFSFELVERLGRNDPRSSFCYMKKLRK